jgi:hypothetical protein
MYEFYRVEWGWVFLQTAQCDATSFLDHLAVLHHKSNLLQLANNQRSDIPSTHFLRSFAKNTGSIHIKNPHPAPTLIQIRSSASGRARFTVAPGSPEIRCAGMAAVEHRPCGRAKEWNSRPDCWPRRHGASSSQRMLSRPARSRHYS